MNRGDSSAVRLSAGPSGLRERLFEMGLAVAVIAVVVMMIVPLTPWLLDLLISVNLGLSVLVLSLALFIRRPIAFTAFPTLLLVATLYRLALNVSSTRLILLRADAGRIIGGFGGFVVGGDILVGAVIFGILAMVLFLVITKGAERVAEVAARFTLDALPGMQLAIDSELRAGAVSPQEASRARGELDRQSRYYGALDGAMKFVRGDAIAGLVIICVNIVGGLAVGMLRHGMSAGQALDTYGRLTIGDGLVTMIPALLVSTAAGLLVTRVGQGDAEGRLGDQLGRQLFAEPRALAAASVMMFVLAVVPGLPAWPFVLLGVGLGSASILRFRRERRREMARGGPERDELESVGAGASAAVDLGSALFGELSAEARERGGWRAVAMGAAVSLNNELGLPIGAIPFADGADGLSPREVRLRVHGVIAGQIEVPPDCALTLASKERLEGVGVEPRGQTGTNAFWISSGDTSLARAADLTVLDPLDGIVSTVEAWMRSKAGQLVGLDETQYLLDRLGRERPVLIRETIPKAIELPALAEILAGLVVEGVSLDHLGQVLEVLSRGKKTSVSDDLLQQVRHGLAPVITAQVMNGRDSLRVVALDSDVEAVLEDGLSQTARGRRLALQAEVINEFVRAVQVAVDGQEHPVLLVKPQLRRSLAELLAVELSDLKVVAHGEIEPHIRVEIVGKVAV